MAVEAHTGDVWKMDWPHHADGNKARPAVIVSSKSQLAAEPKVRCWCVSSQEHLFPPPMLVFNENSPGYRLMGLKTQSWIYAMDEHHAVPESPPFHEKWGRVTPFTLVWIQLTMKAVGCRPMD